MQSPDQPNDRFWKVLAVIVVAALVVCAAAWSYNQFSQGRAVQEIIDLPNQMAAAGQELQEEFRDEFAKAQEEASKAFPTEPVVDTNNDPEEEPIKLDPDVPIASDWWAGMSAEELNKLWWRITLECRNRFADPESGKFEISTEAAAPLASEYGISVRDLVKFWEKSQHATWRTERAPD